MRPVEPAFAELPVLGRPIVVADGVLWFRLAIPFRLDHVNVFVLDDGDGWFVFDTGCSDAPTRAAWRSLLGGVLAGRPVTRILASHHHLDHCGAAGTLQGWTGAPVLMTAMERAAAEEQVGRDIETWLARRRAFDRAAGLPEAAVGGGAAPMMQLDALMLPLPERIDLLAAGDTLSVGGRRWRVLTGGGHSPDQVVLAGDGIVLGADQLLGKISPHVGVYASDPAADPLAAFLDSLALMRGRLDADALVLPGHGVPYRGLHDRIDRLIAFHEGRCQRTVDHYEQRPGTLADVVPTLFASVRDDWDMRLALAESLAHVNRVLRQGRLRIRPGPGAIVYEAA